MAASDTSKKQYLEKRNLAIGPLDLTNRDGSQIGILNAKIELWLRVRIPATVGKVPKLAGSLAISKLDCCMR